MSFKFALKILEVIWISLTISDLTVNISCCSALEPQSNKVYDHLQLGKPYLNLSDFPTCKKDTAMLLYCTGQEGKIGCITNIHRHNGTSDLKHCLLTLLKICVLLRLCSSLPTSEA